MIALITKLWEVAWDLWDYRNSVYHDKQNLSLQEDKSAIDLQVRELIQQLSLTGLRPKDRHLASITLERLLDFPRAQKIEWIRQTTLALAQYKRWNFHLRRSQHEHYLRHHRMILAMQTSLRNWLHKTTG
jgi:hypothetical protein